MITVEEAERIILDTARDYGTETLMYQYSQGRILAEEITADRDLPPCNRVTMDGIAISFESYLQGCRTFKVAAMQLAGEEPVSINGSEECIEIMTGSALHDSLDTIIPYEAIDLVNGMATLTEIKIVKNQNIHKKGGDKKAGEKIVEIDKIITPQIVSVAASVGKVFLLVKKLPRVIIISTGNEIIEPEAIPLPFQYRSSNAHLIQTVLHQNHISTDILHLQDEANSLEHHIKNSLDNYDVIITSGGVSMGSTDLLPKILLECGVAELFHKVQQRPGKPLWFGRHKRGAIVFAMPGNPLSVSTCVYRYFLPWLRKCLGVLSSQVYAALSEDVIFQPQLTWFLQVKLQITEKATLIAMPVTNNGSGDFSSMTGADGMMQLPAKQTTFKKGEIFPVWWF